MEWNNNPAPVLLVGATVNTKQNKLTYYFAPHLFCKL